MKSLMSQGLLDDWRELEAGGIPLEPMEYRMGINIQNPSRGLVIEQVGEPASNVILELEHGLIAYLLNPLILSDVPGKTVIMSWELEIPWEDFLFQWLPDPAENGPKGAPYSFPSKSPIQYPREMVLNHRTYKKGVLMRGDPLEGLLLGVGCTPVPERYPQGAEIPLTLKIWDQWRGVHSSVFLMWLIRRDKPTPKKSARRSLFDGADLVDSMTVNRGSLR